MQSVWVTLLQGFRQARWRFADANHLRAFLIKATRNRFLDRVRQAQTAGARERPLAATAARHLPPAPQPRPSEVAQAGDLWERIQDRCPPEHRPILDLRREGYSLSEIGERTGLHPDSVRRILRLLARQMAFSEG